MNPNDNNPSGDDILMNEMILDLCCINGNDGNDLGYAAHSTSSLTQYSDNGKTKKRKRKVTDNCKAKDPSASFSPPIVSVETSVNANAFEDSTARFAATDVTMTKIRQIYPEKNEANFFHEMNGDMTTNTMVCTPAVDNIHPEHLYAMNDSKVPKAKRKATVSHKTNSAATKSPEVDVSSCVYRILSLTSEKNCRPGFSVDDSQTGRDVELAITELSYLCKAKLYYDQHRNVETPEPQLSNSTPDAGKFKHAKEKSPKTKKAHQEFRSQRLQLDVEIEALISLVDILTKHVQAALGVHLIEDATRILKSLPSSKISRSDDFDQVSCDLVLVVAVKLHHC
jgi:hypothetical protein